MVPCTSPQTGECRGGPCRTGLVTCGLRNVDGRVRWHTAANLQPLVVTLNDDRPHLPIPDSPQSVHFSPP